MISCDHLGWLHLAQHMAAAPGSRRPRCSSRSARDRSRRCWRARPTAAWRRTDAGGPPVLDLGRAAALDRVDDRRGVTRFRLSRRGPRPGPNWTSGPSQHSLMQPTPRTSTSSSSPASSTAGSRFFSTSLEPCETQPAAMQQRRRLLAGRRKVPVSLISWSSLSVMAGPFVQFFQRISGVCLAQTDAVISHRRRHPAGTDAARGQQ